MICSNCPTVNTEDANFCINCNYRISLVCSRCSRRVPSHAKFCDRCGFTLDAQAQAVKSRSVPEEVTPEQIPVAPTSAPATATPQSMTPSTEPDLSESIEVEAPAVESPLSQYIPKELMKKLEAARNSSTMVGERRVVTMLFCDVKGSTSAAEKLDPEEWSEIINGAFEHMIKPVYTYEGTVARLMGDSILAFFGAPLAHEDDPQRAVLAGLDVIAGIAPYREKVMQEWGIDLNIRVGINTGLVVVGAVGSDLRMEYTALGDAINLAARMEQTAVPGTVQIAYDTYKLVKPLFEFKELGGIEVKGKEESVMAYRVLERKMSVGRVRGVEGLHAEMVGREVEMQTLHSVVNDLKQGVGRIVVVLGEAGLGKSRLVSETHQYLESQARFDGNWYETSSLSYETHQAYGLVQRLIRQVSGIGYDDAPRMMQKKLASLVESLPTEDRSRATQLFEALFGLVDNNGSPTLEGESFKNELSETIQQWLRIRFSKQPTVLVFDDMHWSDPASIDLIQQLLQLTAEIPLVVICAMRAERQAPAWQIKTTADEEFHHRYTEISLRPLSASESNELVDRLLAIADIPDGLRTNILEKSGGNPFFIEEVVRTLIENGVVVCEQRVVDGDTKQYWVATSDSADFDIPDNLQSLLAARMDRLEEATRATLQLASVIGRNFYLRVLQAVNKASPELDRHLGTLLRLDMIRESARVPEVEYSFRNPLTQEAVYKTILLKHRQEFHHQVGEVMEALYQERLDGLYGLLAHHFTLAGEHSKAVEYCRLAASQAVAVYAYSEAAQNLKNALQLLEPDKNRETYLVVVEELADVCRLVRDFAEAISLYQQALELLSGMADSDNVRAIRLHRKIVEIATEAKWSVDADAYQKVSEVSQKSQASLRDSLRAMEEESPHAETVQLLAALSVDAWRVQTPPDWDAAQHFAKRAVEMAEGLADAVLLSQALGVLSNVLDGQSLLRENLRVAQRRLEICQDTDFNDQRELIDAQRGAGMALMYVGEYVKALPHLQKAEELAIEIRSPDQIANALGIQAQCLFRLDRWDEVLATEERWRDLDLRYTRQRVGET
jgi:class 3 adenylate cyclase/tetratricopeptide (TPR) repeat protein